MKQFYFLKYGDLRAENEVLNVDLKLKNENGLKTPEIKESLQPTEYLLLFFYFLKYRI